MIKLNLLILLVLSLSLLNCKGADGGFAPTITNAPIAKIVPTTASYNLKNGTVVKTTNGWNLQLDTTDPIKNITTANGWKVEVKYE